MKNILLLHGAIGCKAQLQPMADFLSSDSKVHTINFEGHGGEGLPNYFSIESFADSVKAYILQQNIFPIHIFGYSMGGYVAMYLASKEPQLVASIVTLATKFHWDEVTAAKETAMLNPEKISLKLPAFATELQHRHAPNNWKAVLQKTADMLHAMGNSNPLQPSDYKTIETPILLMLGDRDKMVSLEETVAVYKSLSKAQLAILPNTGHPIEKVNLIVFEIYKQFVQLLF